MCVCVCWVCADSLFASYFFAGRFAKTFYFRRCGTVEQCKRKWKNLRDAYRAEIRRSQRRMERDKEMGEYNPSTDYNSKWVYFEPMNFINDCKRTRRSFNEHENTSSNDATYDETFPRSGSDLEAEEKGDNDGDDDAGDNCRDMDDDDERANDILFEEFQSIATPQAARRLSSTLSLTNSIEQNLSNEATEKHTPHSSTDDAKECNCPSQREERVHFLEDLEKEEQQLMQSTKRDMSRAMNHIGDSDYNFLVSFLPHMKKMTDLQNLQFRGRMCDLVLNILAPSISGQNSPAPIPPPLTPAPTMAALESPALRQSTSTGFELSNGSNGSVKNEKDDRF